MAEQLGVAPTALSFNLKELANSRLASSEARGRIDTPNARDYYRHGGILQYVLRQLASQAA